MKSLILAVMLLTTPALADDFKITIPPGDALDAINAERDRVIATGQSDYTTEQTMIDALVTKFAAEREGQLRQKAIDSALASDADYQAFVAKKAQAEADALAAAQVQQQVLELSR